MSTSKTEHLQLHRWEQTDGFRREEFNENFQKVDAGVRALTAAMPRMAVGSYVGTGAYGAGSPNTLTFDFAPKLVAVTANKLSYMESGNVFVAGQTLSSGMGYGGSSSDTCDTHIQWVGNTVSWYDGYARAQLNESGVTYFYFAIG